MNPAILVLDNYDSFTYNLVHLLRELYEGPIDVHRNDRISVTDALQYATIVLSPGPGLPAEAGIMPELVRAASDASRILGVCLGHQCIAEVFGGTLRNLASVVHGRGTPAFVTEPESLLFRGVPREFIAGRYHSWVVEAANFPETLRITATDAAGEIMALEHRARPIFGVQFHPESVLTPEGAAVVANFLRGDA